MGYCNIAVIQGNLTADPEVKYTQNNSAVSEFSVAVNTWWKAGKKPRVDFFNVVAWGHMAENLCKCMRKGGNVTVTGRLQQDTWKDKNGNTRYKTYIYAQNISFNSSSNSGDFAPKNPGVDVDADEEWTPLNAIDDGEVPF